ncbi:hypothetical protein GCM10027082_18770 [Comamonas humi]
MKKLPIAKLDHWAERFGVPRLNVVQAAAQGRFGLYFMFDGFVSDLPNPNPGHPLQLRPYRGYLLADQATLEAVLNGEARYVREAYEPGGGRVYVELAPNGTRATPLHIRTDELFAAGDDVAAQAPKSVGVDGAAGDPVSQQMPAITPQEVTAPAAWNAVPRQNAVDTTKLATRQRLIDVFGPFTGMDLSWFKNLRDTPRLRAARKVTGLGGRGQIAEPLFCPFEVMQWLMDDKRRNRGGRRPLGQDKGWALLQRYFPEAYAPRSVLDPREDD